MVETMGKKSFAFCESHPTCSSWTPVIWTNLDYINLSESSLSDSATTTYPCVSQNSVERASVHLPKLTTILAFLAFSRFSFQRCEWGM